jgi:hypothetical protein
MAHKPKLPTTSVPARDNGPIIAWPAPLLQGEKAADYEASLARVRCTIKPRGAIDEFLVRDFVDHDWEMHRWRYVKTQLIDTAVRRGIRSALESILPPEPDTDEYEECLKKRRIDKMLIKWTRRDPATVQKIEELLAKAGETFETLLTDAIAGELDDIDRIDRLAALAETRRNAALQEIDRHRAILGTRLRENLEAEDAEFEVVVPPSPDLSGAKNAA